jgi:hypothetical protein
MKKLGKRTVNSIGEMEHFCFALDIGSFQLWRNTSVIKLKNK